MKNNQNLNITAGEYTQIVAPIYTDNTNTTLESDLATGLVVWTLKGVKGIALITKSTANSSITVNAPTAGNITIEILGTDTTALTSGDYYHIAEFTPNSGQKRGVFDGIASIDNRVGGD